ncbi:MAG: hypothetical protein K1W07_15160 [Parabacteroides distasonis]
MRTRSRSEDERVSPAPAGADDAPRTLEETREEDACILFRDDEQGAGAKRQESPS